MSETIVDINPQELIDDLDEGLRNAGEEVKLSRFFGINRIEISVNLQAVIVGYRANEVAGDIQQTDQRFIISPTKINQAQWPGFHNNETEGRDQRIPRRNDEILTDRGRMTVQEAMGRYVQGILVRIEGRIRGA